MEVPVSNLHPLIAATEGAWRKNLDQLFDRGQFILGEQTAAFEREFAEAFGAQHAVTCGSGTAAIELALRDAGITSSEQEVLTSALTSPFTATAICAAGASVRFADVDAETLQIDAGDIHGRLSNRTAALAPVHLYGQPAPIEDIQALGRPVVQDACQAHGAQSGGKPLTHFSKYVAYSFYPTKNLGCLGDGGAILTDDSDAAERLRSIRDGGRRSGGQVSHSQGINSRLDEMQACYLRAFLPHLEEWNGHRKRMAVLYDQLLSTCAGVRLVQRTQSSVCHLYVIRTERRDELREFLRTRGVGTGVHYPVPLHLHPAFQECGQEAGELPRAEKACREVLSLPLWPYIGESAIAYVSQAVRSFF